MLYRQYSEALCLQYTGLGPKVQLRFLCAASLYVFTPKVQGMGWLQEDI